MDGKWITDWRMVRRRRQSLLQCDNFYYRKKNPELRAHIIQIYVQTEKERKKERERVNKRFLKNGI